MLCTLCSTNLPDGSQFCLKCGQKLDATAQSVALATISAQPTCDECGNSLPRSAEFCPRCGRPVVATANRSALGPVLPSDFERPQPLPWPRLQLLVVLWLLALILLGAALWVTTSDTAVAEQAKEFVRWSHTQTIVDGALPLNARSFSSREFTVPRGALSTSVSGEFSETPGTTGKAGKTNATAKDRDTEIDVLVLTDAAFAIWRSGYSTQTSYESGPVASAIINAPLPAGGGVYHLVFSNRSSPRARTVRATVLLRYKSWVPDAVVHLKDQFWSWFGL